MRFVIQIRTGVYLQSVLAAYPGEPGETRALRFAQTFPSEEIGERFVQRDDHLRLLGAQCIRVSAEDFARSQTEDVGNLVPCPADSH